MINTRKQWLALGNVDREQKIQSCRDKIVRTAESEARIRNTKITNYAIDTYTGKLIHISEVDFDKSKEQIGRYRCASPTCENILIPYRESKNGKKSAHFQHKDGESCILPKDANGKNTESLLHLQSKLKIKQEGLILPDISIYDIRNTFEPNIPRDNGEDIIVPSHQLSLSNVKVEEILNNRRVDIFARHGKINVLIEVCVTSPVSEEKLRDLIAYDQWALIIEVYPEFTEDMDIDLSNIRVLYGGLMYRNIYDMVRLMCKRIEDRECDGTISGCYVRATSGGAELKDGYKLVVNISGDTPGCCEQCKYFMGIDHKKYDCVLCATRLPPEQGAELPMNAIELISTLRKYLNCIV